MCWLRTTNTKRNAADIMMIPLSSRVTRLSEKNFSIPRLSRSWICRREKEPNMHSYAHPQVISSEHSITSASSLLLRFIVRIFFLVIPSTIEKFVSKIKHWIWSAVSAGYIFLFSPFKVVRITWKVMQFCQRFSFSNDHKLSCENKLRNEDFDSVPTITRLIVQDVLN